MSTSYSIDRDTIITSALRKLGVIELGETPDVNTVTNSAQALNLMIKQWATDGIKLWTVVEYSLPLVTSQTSYTVGPAVTNNLVADKPMKLIQAWIRNTSVTPNIDTPLQIISQQEYNILGSKGSTGIANSIYLNPGVVSSTVYTYLTPDTNTATNYVIHMVVQIQIQDVLLSTDIPDFPNEWMNALVWGLADQLAIEYSVPSNHRQEILLKAEKYREQVSGASVAAESSFFQPNYQMVVNNYY